MTGTALQCSTAAGVEKTVNAGTITSSPTPTPAPRSALCMVAVPLQCAMPYTCPKRSANCRSRRAVMPTECALWNPKSRTSFT